MPYTPISIDREALTIGLTKSPSGSLGKCGNGHHSNMFEGFELIKRRIEIRRSRCHGATDKKSRGHLIHIISSSTFSSLTYLERCPQALYVG